MLGHNAYYPIYILTHKGVKEISDIIPGDFVYEYRTNKLLEVQEVPTPTQTIINHIIYSDRRTDYIRDYDCILLGGDEIVPVMMVNPRYDTFTPIKLYPIEYYQKGIRTPLDPDPYLTGALLVYGAYDDPYVNLPYYLTGINDVFAHKWNVDYASDGIGLDGRVYFKLKSDPEEKRITWKQFFGNKEMYVLTKKMKLPIIPKEYTIAPLKDRIQLIMGIFDMGYDPKLFKDNKIGIIGSNEHRLKAVQEVLYSLGVVSKVSEDPFIDPYHNNQWKLEIVDVHKGYPGFTYYIDNLKHLLDQDNKHFDYDAPFHVTINPHLNEKVLGFQHSTGYMTNLVLNKRRAIYMGANYLPRVSI